MKWRTSYSLNNLIDFDKAIRTYSDNHWAILNEEYFE